MEELTRFMKGFNLTRLVVPLTVCYFFIASINVIAEINRDLPLIGITKPLLMPIVMMVYVFASKKHNVLFLLALFASWLGNIFLLSLSMKVIMLAILCFIIYRILVIVLVLSVTKFPGYLPMVIGCLPFLFLYIFVSTLVYKDLGDHFIMFIFHGLLLVFFGGYCLGNYILKSNRSNSFLLMSTVLFTAAQLMTIIKIFYIAYTFAQPIAIVTYVFGQYLLVQYLLMEEKKKRRYRAIKSNNAAELH